MWLGKGLLGESRYKICIVTEAASWLGVGLGVLGAQQAQAWALGRWGRRQQARVEGAAGNWVRGRAEQAGAHACWASGRRRGRRVGGALGVSARGARRGRAAWARGVGARRGRACVHGGHAGWVSRASLGFGEPGSVLTRVLTRF